MRGVSISSVMVLALALVACSDGLEAQGEDEAVASAGQATSPVESETADDALGDAYDDSRFFVVVDGDGLGVVRRSDVAVTVLQFGAAADHVAATLAQSIGAPGQQSDGEECGAGPMTFVEFGPLTINIQEDVFAGWTLDGESLIANADGIAIGSRRSDVEALEGFELYEDSTLGDEFFLGDGQGGFFDDEGVASLYAGTTCFFR